MARRLGIATLISLICCTLLACGQRPPVQQFVPATNEASRVDTTEPSAIVIGFVGGFVRRDDNVHSPVQLASRLRTAYPSLFVKVFENRRREEAYDEILRLLDRDHDGSLSGEEKRAARIIIYGISWGGSATVDLARQLDKDGIPVLLTIQVDSVTKIGKGDRTIPSNVAEAANFYQPNGLLHGAPEIQAADPLRTRILGNFRYDYKSNPIECANYPWYDGIFWKQHTEIECDPKVWERVESLIRSKL